MSDLKYGSQIEQMFRDLFFEDWMSESDWQEFKAETLDEYLEKLNTDIETGVKNGYSVEQQLNICAKVLKTLT